MISSGTGGRVWTAFMVDRFLSLTEDPGAVALSVPSGLTLPDREAASPSRIIDQMVGDTLDELSAELVAAALRAWLAVGRAVG